MLFILGINSDARGVSILVRGCAISRGDTIDDVVSVFDRVRPSDGEAVSVGDYAEGVPRLVRLHEAHKSVTGQCKVGVRVISNKDLREVSVDEVLVDIAMLL